ncbi:MAG: GNAT family N-acetyltransferase [Anaerolineae bacterium]|nr:GNAT family N-acetyltransferase [Anaerolineae bacterium]
MTPGSPGAGRDEGHVRPVDPGRDMAAIADLIEIAFRGELDQVGRGIVAEMRQLAMLGPLLTVVEQITTFPGGFVWEQDGRLIGNASISLEDAASGRWFMSNVAVHPDYQGRGIGRRVVEEALEAIRRHGGRQIVLQVRVDNEPAQRLYRRLGFERFDTVVELLRPGLLPFPAQPDIHLRRLGIGDWPALLELARAATPAAVQRVRPLGPGSFHPPLRQRIGEWLEGLLVGRLSGRWAVQDGREFLGVVSLLADHGRRAARLDLAVRPDARGRLEGPLADAGLAMLGRWGARSVAANVSTGHPEALQALRERHFLPGRRLDQLVLWLR